MPPQRPKDHPCKDERVTYMEYIETAAASYGRWSHAPHGGALHALNADPEVNAFLGGEQPPAFIDEVSHHIAAHWDEHGFGLWAVIVDGECVGFSGACHPGPGWPDELRGEVELGWRLARHAWGRGLATEGGRLAAVAVAEHLGLARVVSLVAPDNERSIAVTRRLGMTPAGTTRGGRVPTDVSIFGLPIRVPAA